MESIKLATEHVRHWNNDELSAVNSLKALVKKPIKRILLIQPPDLDAGKFSFDLARKKRYWNYPPYGLLLLAKVAQEVNCEVTCLNLQDEILRFAFNNEAQNLTSRDYNTFIEKLILRLLKEIEFDTVGVSCMFSLTHQSFLNVIEILSENTAAPILIGGVHVTNAYSDTKTRASFLSEIRGVSVIFLRESENAFKNFINFVNGNYRVTDTPSQVVIKVGDNYFELAGDARPSDRDLDLLPAYDLSPPTRLSEVGRIGTFESILPPRTRIATALFNRGCRAECTFCSVRNFNGRGVRSRSIHSILEELKILKFDYGINHIMWLDDDLLFDRRRSVELFNSMIRERIDITWDTTNGVIAASCTEEVISAAAASGCVGLILGMESGNGEILKRIKKPGNVRHFLMAAEVLRRFPQINTRVFVMIGFPGETFRQIQDSYEVAREMDVDWVNINILQPLPNTPIFDEMVSAGLLDADGIRFEDVAFSLGASGKLSGRRIGGKDMLAEAFQDVFDPTKLDSVPTALELDDIWAYMNFHLNFHRLRNITDPLKLRIQYKWLNSICETLAPTNAFAKYYRCAIETSIFGAASEESFSDLVRNLEGHPYWLNRFSEYSLSVADINRNRQPKEPIGT